MKNFVQRGEAITLTAPAAVVSGAGVLIGSMFGIASGDAIQNETVTLAVVGVYELGKVATDDFSVGKPAYWNDTTKLVTTTAAGNTKIGVAVAPAGNPSGTVKVRLNGAF